MNNLKLFLVLTINFFPVWLAAKQISPAVARQVAETQVRSHNQLRNNQLPELNLVYVKATNTTAAEALAKTSVDTPVDAIYYVFNMEEQGFIIVSGDDTAIPVLGYSETGVYDPDNLPPNFVYYLDCLANEIKYAIDNNLPQSEKTKALWDENLTGNIVSMRTASAVSPLLDIEGIKWNQGAPYNNACPMDPVTKVRSVTGCAATAMAQIMRYYKYPAKGNGIIPAYTTSNRKISIPATNIDNYYYIWGNMLPQYPGAASGTEAQRTAVADLMYHCGISATMDYASSSSGANTRSIGLALMNHFDYDYGLHLKRRMYYTTTEWETVLKEEIDNMRPVYYAGYNSESGHAFVCDGYDDTGKFHFNWGWGGSLNGYFTTSVLNPGKGEIGSGSGTYNEDQEILVNYKPNSGGTMAYELAIGPNAQGGTFTYALSEVNVEVFFTVNTGFYNLSLFPFKGEVGIALYNQTNQLIEVIGRYPITSLASGSYYSSLSIYCQVPESVPSGNYLIKPVAISPSEEIFPVLFPAGITGSLPLKVIVPVKGVTLDKTELGLGIGGSAQLNPVFTPAVPTNTNVSWLSSNSAVASVANGLVTAVSKGQAIITVRTADGNYEATCNVSVREPAVILLNPVSGKISGNDLYLYETTSGSGVILPEAVPCNDGWTFAGWSKNLIDTPTEPMDESTVSAGLIPSGLFVPVEETLTLYAVYKKYENKGIKDRLSLFTDFNIAGGFWPAGWTGPGTYYATAGINGSVCRTFVKAEDVISTPFINDPSRISFFIRRINAYSGSIVLSVQISKRDNPDVWTNACTYSYGNNELQSSWTLKECDFGSLNLSGEYKIRFILISADAEYSSNLGLDDVTIYAAFVDEGNSFSSVIDDCNPSTIAWQGKDDTDWGNFLNWQGGQIPSNTDNVLILSNAPNFPILNKTTTVTEIRFEPGAQIGGQHHLDGTAFIQYDLNKRNQWNMLSMPLKEAYPGDFTFGGYPLTWVRTFKAETENSVTKGSWVTASGGNTGAFSFGDGFVVWLNPDGTEEKGLKLLEGILELPNYFNFEAGVNNYDLYKDVNLAQDYFDGVSTFYKFIDTGEGYVREDENDDNKKYTVTRSTDAYQLAGNNFTTLPKSIGFFDGFALIGNPFMATLDFDKFSSANSSTINSYYYVWMDNTYKIYHPVGGDLDKFIVPLQGFVVTQSEELSTSLSFDESMTSVTGDAGLRSSLSVVNKLDILASNPVASIRTFIAKREGGNDVFGNLDARKIMNEISEVPEIFTLKPYKSGSIATAMNIINSNESLIPLGLATSYVGEITLTFSGMDSYDSQLSLIDTRTNRTIDLTGLASYDYTVYYSPEKLNGETVACEDRFFIHISKSPTGLNETITEKVNVFESNGFIRIISSVANPIKEVAVHDLQGALIYKVNDINAVSHTVERNLLTGVYIVKVVSEDRMEFVKFVK